MLPHIGIFKSPFVKGVQKLDGPIEAIATFEHFETAMQAHFDYDAHAVMYAMADQLGNVALEMPRLTKPVLPEIRRAGHEVYLSWFGVDIDAPEHATLTPEILTSMEDSLAAALPRLPPFTAYYTTRAGMRLIYVLDEPVRADEGEPYIVGLLKRFQDAGMPADPTARDWTRLFRLPRVLRERAPLGRRAFDEVVILPDNRLCLGEIAPIFPSASSVPIYTENLADPLPDDSIFADLCEEFNKQGNPQPSAFFKEAKNRLKGRKCFPCIFSAVPLATSSRNDTIQKYVGEACALLIHLDGTSPQHVYALFLPAVMRLAPDTNGPDWRIQLWKAVCTYWPKEQARIDLENNKEIDTWVSVVEGMREWDTHPDLHSPDPNIVREYVLRRGILSIDNKYFILKPDGHYETVNTDRAHLIARIRELGMDRVLNTSTMNGKAIADQSIQGMLNANLASGFEIEGMVVDDGRDGTIEGNRLIRTLFRRRTDIEPEHNADVDAWLRHFGGQQYPKLIEWIGLALAWDEGPICALSIKGPPGCGKKLLVQGLIECTDNQHDASDATEFGRFKSGIFHSPLLVINEGLPSSESMPVSDLFRKFVGGDPIRVEEKYKVPATVRNPLRIIFTTNNDDVVRALAGGRDLTHFDREAIAQRLFHVDVKDSASAWLNVLGGLRFTRGWIAGDAGAKSRHVIAKHFLHLYHQRPKRDHAEGRFLMEGSNNERLIKAMTLRSGGAPAVFEVITRLIELSGKREKCAVIEPDGRIFITEYMIEKYEQTEYSNRKTNHHVIKNVLAAMRMPGTEPEQGFKGVGKDRALAVWHQLNAKMILDEAIERGLECMKLQSIMNYVPDEMPVGQLT